MNYKFINDYVECTNLKKNFTFLIDKDDFSLVKDKVWFLNWKGYVFGAKNQFVHQLVMNCPRNMQIDHINNNKLDNRKSNLRICTAQQNLCNRPRNKTNKSGFKGVIWDKQAKKWRASITIGGKTKTLGRFINIKDAAICYNNKAKELFGEYAYQNVIN